MFVREVTGICWSSKTLDIFPELQLTVPDVVRPPFKTREVKLKSPSSEAAAIVRIPPVTTNPFLLA